MVFWVPRLTLACRYLVFLRGASQADRGGTTSSDLPPLPILPPDELIRGGAAEGFEVRRVPGEFLAGAVGDVAELDGLGQGAGVVEVAGGGGGVAGFAGVDPFEVVAGSGGDHFRQLLGGDADGPIERHAGAGEQSAEEIALVALDVGEELAGLE